MKIPAVFWSLTHRDSEHICCDLFQVRLNWRGLGGRTRENRGRSRRMVAGAVSRRIEGSRGSTVTRSNRFEEGRNVVRRRKSIGPVVRARSKTMAEGIGEAWNASRSRYTMKQKQLFAKRSP